MMPASAKKKHMDISCNNNNGSYGFLYCRNQCHQKRLHSTTILVGQDYMVAEHPNGLLNIIIVSNHIVCYKGNALKSTKLRSQDQFFYTKVHNLCSVENIIKY